MLFGTVGMLTIGPRSKLWPALIRPEGSDVAARETSSAWGDDCRARSPRATRRAGAADCGRARPSGCRVRWRPPVVPVGRSRTMCRERYSNFA